MLGYQRVQGSLSLYFPVLFELARRANERMAHDSGAIAGVGGADREEDGEGKKNETSQRGSTKRCSLAP